MIKHIILCDICGNDIPYEERQCTLSVFIGRWSDGEPSSSDHYESGQYCLPCLIHAIQAEFKNDEINGKCFAAILNKLRERKP